MIWVSHFLASPHRLVEHIVPRSQSVDQQVSFPHPGHLVVTIPLPGVMTWAILTPQDGLTGQVGIDPVASDGSLSSDSKHDFAPSSWTTLDVADWLGVLVTVALGIALVLAVGPKFQWKYLGKGRPIPTVLPLLAGALVGSLTGGLTYNVPGKSAIAYFTLLVLLTLKDSRFHLLQKKSESSNSNAAVTDLASLIGHMKKAIDEDLSLTTADTQKTMQSFERWIEEERPIISSSTDLDLLRLPSVATEIAGTLVKYIGSPNQSIRIGILGPYGSGKSSLINLALDQLDQQSSSGSRTPIICRVSIWGCKSSSGADSYLLQRILDEVSKHIDTTAFNGIPTAWTRRSEATPSSWRAVMSCLYPQPDFLTSLAELGKALASSSLHLLLVLEDLDRNKDKDYDPRQVQGLLEHLKLKPCEGGLDCSMLIATDDASCHGDANPNTGLDCSRLCEQLRQPPGLPPITIATCINFVGRHHIPDRFLDWKTIQGKPCGWSAIYGNSRSKNSLGNSVAGSSNLSPLELKILLQTPRLLKHFFRSLHYGWQTIREEVDYGDFFLVKLLQVGAPTTLQLINSRIDLLRAYSCPNTLQRKDPDDLKDLQEVFRKHLDTLGPLAYPIILILQQLFGSLLTTRLQLGKDSGNLCWISGDTMRVKDNPYPVNFWNRAITARLDPNEPTASETLKAHEEWRNSKGANDTLLDLFENEQNEVFWVELAPELDPQEVLSLTKSLLVRKATSTTGELRVVNTYPIAAHSATSALQYLRLKAHLHLGSSDDLSVDEFKIWLQDTFSDLLKVNIQAAATLALEWSRARAEENVVNDLQSEFPDLQKRLKELFCDWTSECKDNTYRFFATIPAPPHSAARIYPLLQLFSGNQSSELGKTTPHLDSGFQDLWNSAFSAQTVCNKIAAKAVDFLFQLDSSGQKVTLIRDAPATLFGHEAAKQLEILKNSDLSSTLWHPFKAQIVAEVDEFLDNSKMD